MKKVSLLIMLLFAGIVSMAQSLDDIKDLVGKGKFSDAKTAIDKYLLEPKKANSSEAWFYKGRIYNLLSRESATPHNDLYILRKDAFDAFKKNQELDKKDLFLSLDSHISYLDLYLGFYDLGVQEFNAKNFDAAFEAFKKALEVKDYTLAKKYEYTQVKLYALDTALVLNTAASGIQAKREDEAMIFYKKIADANVAIAEYKDVYKYLAEYYLKKDDDASLQDLLQKAKRLYPKDDFWTDIELRVINKKGDKEVLYAKYETLIAENPSSFFLGYNYSVEMYNALYGKAANKQGDIAFSNKLTDVIKKTIANETEDNSATILMAIHLFNMSADLLNASNMIRSTKPVDLKRKADLKSASNKSMEECIIYSELVLKYIDAIPKKTGIQKANYKMALNYLSDIYNLKNNKAKAAEYDKKIAIADKW